MERATVAQELRALFYEQWRNFHIVCVYDEKSAAFDVMSKQEMLNGVINYAEEILEAHDSLAVDTLIKSALRIAYTNMVRKKEKIYGG